MGDQDLEKIISYLAGYKAEYYVGKVCRAPESNTDNGIPQNNIVPKFMEQEALNKTGNLM